MSAWAAFFDSGAWIIVLAFLIWGAWEAWILHRSPPQDADPSEDTEHMHPHRRFEDRVR